jgi:hypothetical protein
MWFLVLTICIIIATVDSFTYHALNVDKEFELCQYSLHSFSAKHQRKEKTLYVSQQIISVSLGSNADYQDFITVYTINMMYTR